MHRLSTDIRTIKTRNAKYNIISMIHNFSRFIFLKKVKKEVNSDTIIEAIREIITHFSVNYSLTRCNTFVPINSKSFARIFI